MKSRERLIEKEGGVFGLGAVIVYDTDFLHTRRDLYFVSLSVSVLVTAPITPQLLSH